MKWEKCLATEELKDVSTIDIYCPRIGGIAGCHT